MFNLSNFLHIFGCPDDTENISINHSYLNFVIRNSCHYHGEHQFLIQLASRWHFNMTYFLDYTVPHIHTRSIISIVDKICKYYFGFFSFLEEFHPVYLIYVITKFFFAEIYIQ